MTYEENKRSTIDRKKISEVMLNMHKFKIQIYIIQREWDSLIKSEFLRCNLRGPLT